MPLLQVLGLHKPIRVAQAAPVVAPGAAERARYVAVRDEAKALLQTMRRLKPDPAFANMDALLLATERQVKSARPNYVQAVAAIEPVRRELADKFREWAVDKPNTRISALRRSPAAAFMADDIKQLAQLQGEVAAARNGRQFAKTYLGARELYRVLETAEDVAQRRSLFEAQLTATQAALDAVRQFPALKAQLAVLEPRVAAAQALAERAAMHFEAGTAELEKIDARCQLLQAFGNGSEALATERGAADKQLAALRKHAAAGALGAQLAAIDALLAQSADTAKNAATTDDPVPGTKAARAIVARAFTDLAAVQKMADGLGAKLKGLPPKGKAATALVAQAEHARYAALRSQVEKRQASLLALPAAKAIVAKTDAVAQALALAQQHDAAAKGSDAVTALHAAEDALLAAETAAAARAAFDTRVATLVAGKARLIEGDAGVHFEKLLLKARGQADTFAFDAAKRVLDAAETELERLNVGTLAALDPNNAALVTSAQKMKELSGPESIDKLVETLPDNRTSEQVIAKLAEVRFGKKFEVEAGNQGTAAVKRIYAMMAKVPQDVVGNPSLKKVTRKKKTPEGGDIGGLYMAEEETISMYGRPGVEEQAFGAKLKNKQKKAQLPNDVEESCVPQDDKPVELMDWTTLHEVGHSLDDSNNFMGQHGKDDEYGGWREYGGKVEPIADAVAAYAKYDLSAEQKRYVLELILGSEPTPPPPLAGHVKQSKDGLAEVKRWYKLATTDEVWRDNAASMSMCIGDRIYQRAYPDQWVSYKAAARKRGLTGFQFKAPGEWFAELYAGYKSGKLKPNHPAVKWLSTIKV